MSQSGPGKAFLGLYLGSPNQLKIMPHLPNPNRWIKEGPLKNLALE